MSDFERVGERVGDGGELWLPQVGEVFRYQEFSRHGVDNFGLKPDAFSLKTADGHDVWPKAEFVDPDARMLEVKPRTGAFWNGEVEPRLDGGVDAWMVAETLFAPKVDPITGDALPSMSDLLESVEPEVSQQVLDVLTERLERWIR